MTRLKQPKPIPQMTVAEFEALFPDEAACDAYLIARRWPDGVTCPRCGSTRAYKLATMENKWECPDCSKGGYRFSHLVGTIFENTNKDLRDWFRVIHLMLTSKKGISALQVMRYMGFGSYKTAHYMCHRIRVALFEKQPGQLAGIVEIDETYIGGKAKNKHWDKRGDGGGPTAGGMTPVAGAVSRKGKVVARVLAVVNRETVTRFVREAVSHKVSLLASDDSRSYSSLKFEYPHKAVNHSAGEYVVGAVHTNTIEGFWSIMKRGVVGTFHKVSAKYLPLYVAEFEFRYNNRHNPDIFGTAVGSC